MCSALLRLGFGALFPAFKEEVEAGLLLRRERDVRPLSLGLGILIHVAFLEDQKKRGRVKSGGDPGLSSYRAVPGAVVVPCITKPHRLDAKNVTTFTDQHKISTNRNIARVMGSGELKNCRTTNDEQVVHEAD